MPIKATTDKWIYPSDSFF